MALSYAYLGERDLCADTWQALVHADSESYEKHAIEDNLLVETVMVGGWLVNPLTWWDWARVKLNESEDILYPGGS